MPVHGFLGRALVELVLIGGLCGALGVQVVLRRLAFGAELVGHAAFPGVVAASVGGVDPRLGALAGAATATALPTGRRPALTGVAISAGLALGVLLISARPGFSRDLSALIAGSPLTVTRTDLEVAAGVAATVSVLLLALHKELLLGAFDPEAIAAQGYPRAALDLTVRAAIALTVVTALPAVGVLLPLALLAGPAGAAVLWIRRVGPATVVAAVLGAVCGASGLWASTRWHLATAATVAVLSGGLFLLAAATSAAARRLSDPNR
ncbi:metal ABC transporter permease [Actinomadura oligospora]|uniref:metal ABC transporter permease n=1 Tax=Actinomadura oligospora TaxID=111804 RepID=UPI0004AC91E4|nr:metal ABC transporter permease [Actinomadura oligospora]